MDLWTISPGDLVDLIAQVDQICKGTGGPSGLVNQVDQMDL